MGGMEEEYDRITKTLCPLVALATGLVSHCETGERVLSNI